MASQLPGPTSVSSPSGRCQSCMIGVGRLHEICDLIRSGTYQGSVELALMEWVSWFMGFSESLNLVVNDGATELDDVTKLMMKNDKQQEVHIKSGSDSGSSGVGKAEIGDLVLEKHGSPKSAAKGGGTAKGGVDMSRLMMKKGNRLQEIHDTSGLVTTAKSRIGLAEISESANNSGKANVVSDLEEQYGSCNSAAEDSGIKSVEGDLARLMIRNDMVAVTGEEVDLANDNVGTVDEKEVSVRVDLAISNEELKLADSELAKVNETVELAETPRKLEETNTESAKLDVKLKLADSESTEINEKLEVTTAEVTEASEKVMSTRPKSSGANRWAKGAIVAADVLEEHRSFTIEEIVESGDDCLGLRVVVQTREGIYTGVITYVLPACRRLALEKVVNQHTGWRRVGLLTFFFHSIVSITVVGEDQEARQRLLKDAYKEEQRGKQLLMKKLVPPYLAERNDLYSDASNVQWRERGGKGPKGGKNKASPPSPPPPPPPSPRVTRPSNWLIIDAIDEAFLKAVFLLRVELVIGINAVGQNIGRSGSLSILAAATPNVIFLFDVAKIGLSKLLTSGVADILLDNGIVKVVHDCRGLEDLLHHQCGVNLTNVFDTQASEIYIHMLNYQRRVPLFVSSLPSLLIRYLGLAPQHTFWPTDEEKDESIWLERPLSTKLCEGLARTVRYLKELRLEQISCMLVDLTQITNIYLGSVKDKDSATARSLESHVVPVEIRRLGRTAAFNVPEGFNPRVPFTRNLYKTAPTQK